MSVFLIVLFFVFVFSGELSKLGNWILSSCGQFFERRDRALVNAIQSARDCTSFLAGAREACTFHDFSRLGNAWPVEPFAFLGELWFVARDTKTVLFDSREPRPGFVYAGRIYCYRCADSRREDDAADRKKRGVEHIFYEPIRSAENIVNWSASCEHCSVCMIHLYQPIPEAKWTRV